MKNRKSFWSLFEEPAQADSEINNNHLTTQTRQREEPDQIASTTLVAFLTKTSAREEPDQESNLSVYSAFSGRSAPLSTITLTEAREEPDQDESCQQYASINKRKS